MEPPDCSISTANVLEGVLVFGDHLNLTDTELRTHLKRCMHDGLASLFVVLSSPAWAKRRETLEKIATESNLPLRIIDLSQTGGPLRASHLE
ncbi:MAG: hypothetical protein WA705_12085 [Candidatus Ozemobacteraceae bacterium]